MDPFTAIAIGGGISGGLGLFGSGKQAGAAKNAAGLQYKAAQASIEEQKAAREQQQRYAEEGRREIDASAGSAGRLETLGAREARNTLLGGYGQARGELSGGYEQGIDEFGRQTDIARSRLDPYAALGQQGSSLLSGLASGNFDYTADPGYRFRLQQGEEALARQAAAGGGRLSGARLRAAQEFGQGLASDEYGRAYQRQFGLGSQLLGAGQQASTMLSGIDQGAASTLLGANVNLGSALSGLSLGQASNIAGLEQGLQSRLADIELGRGSSVANILSGQGAAGVASANATGNLLTQQGNAQASGALGVGNAWASGLQGVGNSVNSALGNYMFMNLLGQQGGMGGAYTPSVSRGASLMGQQPWTP